MVEKGTVETLNRFFTSFSSVDNSDSIFGGIFVQLKRNLTCKGNDVRLNAETKMVRDMSQKAGTNIGHNTVIGQFIMTI